MRRLLAALYLLAGLVPLAWLALRAGNGEGGFGPTMLARLADAAWLGAHARALTDAVVGALLAVLLALPAACALARARFVGRRGVIAVLALSRACPPMLVAVGAAEIATRAGYADAPWLVPFAQLAFNLPIAVWILTVGLLRVPQDLVEAARFDRLGPLRSARLVTGPSLGPALGFAILACCAASLGDGVVAHALAQPVAALEASAALQAAGALWSALPAFVLAVLLATLLWRRKSEG